MLDIKVRPDLFPQYFNIKGMWRQRDYVQDVLVELAKRNDLYLTELLNQDPDIIQHVGDVILGHAIDDGRYGAGAGKHTTNVPVPQELLDYRVKIKSAVVEGPNGLTGDKERKVLWDGSQTIQYRQGNRPARNLMAGRGRNRTRIQQFEPNIIDLGVTEASVSLQQAWYILKYSGLGARYLTSEKDLIFCKYVEEKPEPADAPSETVEPRRSGRKRPADMLRGAQ